MRFLHIGNICGIPNSIRDAQIKLGHTSKTLSFDPDPHHISDFDYDIPYSLGRITSCIKRMFILLKIGKDYEVFHFAGNSLANGTDILLWKLMGKKVIIHYHGSEIRNKKQPYFHKFADALFTSIPDLLQFAPGSIWLPNPININDYNVAHPSEIITITHAPSDPKLKGTLQIISAINNLLRKSPDIKFDYISGVPYDTAIEHYRRATIVVDQIKIGWYGMVSLECMAIGTPVICYISPELLTYLPEPHPLCTTSEKTLERDIVTLLNNPNIRTQQIEAGKRYVSTVHDPINIAKIVIKSVEDI